MQVSSRLFTNHDSMSTDHQEREDTATLIADYGKLCVERNKTLESLDDVSCHQFSTAMHE